MHGMEQSGDQPLEQAPLQNQPVINRLPRCGSKKMPSTSAVVTHDRVSHRSLERAAGQTRNNACGQGHMSRTGQTGAVWSGPSHLRPDCPRKRRRLRKLHGVRESQQAQPVSRWAENSIEPCFPNHATTQLWTVFAFLVPRHGSLTGDDLAGLHEHLRRVAQYHPHTELARPAYLGRDDTTAVDTDELLHRIQAGDTVVLDVVRERSSPTAAASIACSPTTPSGCSTPMA